MMILFDAYGTLIHPYPSALEIYEKLGLDFGSSISGDQLKQRFAAARRDIFCSQSPVSNDSIERAMWAKLVATVFIDLPNTDDLFEELWNSFASPEQWRLYYDVLDCLEFFKTHEIPVGIASNFDSRLVRIIEFLLPDFDQQFLFWSARVGFRKPDLRFYQSIQQQIQLNSLTMIGDDYQNDVAPPLQLGWQAIHLDRNSGVGTSSNAEVISSLEELPQLIFKNT